MFSPEDEIARPDTGSVPNIAWVYDSFAMESSVPDDFSVIDTRYSRDRPSGVFC